MYGKMLIFVFQQLVVISHHYRAPIKIFGAATLRSLRRLGGEALARVIKIFDRGASPPPARGGKVTIYLVPPSYNLPLDIATFLTILERAPIKNRIFFIGAASFLRSSTISQYSSSCYSAL